LQVPSSAAASNSAEMADAQTPRQAINEIRWQREQWTAGGPNRWTYQASSRAASLTGVGLVKDAVVHSPSVSLPSGSPAASSPAPSSPDLTWMLRPAFEHTPEPSRSPRRPLEPLAPETEREVKWLNLAEICLPSEDVPLVDLHFVDDPPAAASFHSPGVCHDDAPADDSPDIQSKMQALRAGLVSPVSAGRRSSQAVGCHASPPTDAQAADSLTEPASDVVPGHGQLSHAATDELSANGSPDMQSTMRQLRAGLVSPTS